MYKCGGFPNNFMITLFSTLPQELRFELLHYLPINDLSKFNLKTRQSLNQLIEFSCFNNETLHKSIWYTFLSSKRYTDQYVPGFKSYSDQVNKISSMLCSPGDPYDDLCVILEMGCDKFYPRYINDKLPIIDDVFFDNLDSKRHWLFKSVGNSANIDLLKLITNRYSLNEYDIISLCQGLDHKYNSKDVIEFLNYVLEQIQNPSLSSLIYMVLRIATRHCQTIEEFNNIFTNNGNHWTLKNTSQVCTTFELCENAIINNNETLFLYLFKLLTISTNINNLFIVIPKSNNNYAELMLQNLVHVVDWDIVLNVVIDTNNLELVKLACEHGANGARDNHRALRKAIKYGYKELAIYLWNRFPL